VCKPDSEILKKCMVYEVEGPRPRGRPKRTRREVVEKDCIAPKLNKDDTVNRNKRRKLIKDVWWTGWVWVGECFFWYRPTRVVLDKGPLNSYVCVLLLLLLHPFNGLLSRTTWVSRYQKGKTSLDLTEARGDRVLGSRWHQLDHMQTICTPLQTDNHTNTSSLNFCRPDALPDAEPAVSKHWWYDFIMRFNDDFNDIVVKFASSWVYTHFDLACSRVA